MKLDPNKIIESYKENCVLAIMSEEPVDLNVGHINTMKEYYNNLLTYVPDTNVNTNLINIRGEIDRVKDWLKRHK